MKKGMLAGCMLALLVAAALAAFAINRPADTQYSSEYNEGQKPKGFSYLGVEVTDVEADRVAALKLKEETGVEVTAVDEDAPAGKAGFREHDVILAVNGAKIEGEEQLRRTIRETPPGRTINVLISRDGNQMTLKPTLASHSQMSSFNVVVPDIHVEPHVVVPPMPPMSFAEPPDVPDVRVYHNMRAFGAQVENLTPQLRDFFGVKNGTGILVRSVDKGSPAEAGGLKAGDVIVRIGQEHINDSSDLRRLMRNSSGNVSIGIVRDKREQNVTVKMPERRQTGSAWDRDDFDMETDTEALRQELKDLPKVQEEQKIAMLKAQQEMQKAQEQWRKEFQAHQGEWQKEAEKAAKEAVRERDKAMKDLQKELEKMQKNLQKQFHYISYDEFE